MKRFIQGSVTAIFTLLLVACANKVTHSYNDSFFTFKDEAGTKYFTFVLKLKGEAPDPRKNQYNMRDGQNRGREVVNGRRQQNSGEPQLEEEAPGDELVSIKFRMEEKAHELLNQRLLDSGYCEGPVEIEKEEFKPYRYNIRGYCKEQIEAT